ncbi:ABC transporter permease [Cuneatibacter sp. NSJ-177]|uniref:ABC transporter permease n=1 Tax=Cuneatibacter sp. NSJ-177 TaxID=2931401 RepID=UPI001FD5C807|nr:ABC transporter permease [Cuneatibacter sp. NSJ-177]MCJ7834302.1 ABC transporter permease [Cuneatibacter sp. NSJ-177]
MYERKTNIIFDSWVMFKRCLFISLRNPEALLVATIVPFLLMFLFGTVFGNIANVGDMNYIDFIVPGIILQSLGQSSQYSAMNMTTDMTKGILDRFRTLSISKTAVLIGHTGAGVVRNSISTLIIIGTAFLLGFRPQGNFRDWLLVIGLLTIVNIAISLLAVMCGLLSKTVEGSSGLMLPLFILPFVSSGFVPVDSMDRGLKLFAEIQPMTPIIDSFRALTLGLPFGDSLWTALIWCVGIIIAAFTLSIQIYQRRIS